MTNFAAADRCAAVYRLDLRPRIAHIETARIAGRPIPPTDWRCARLAGHPSTTNPDTTHLAMPLGVRGPSFRFYDDMCEPVAIAPVVHAFLPATDTGQRCARVLPNLRPCNGTAADHADVVDQALAAQPSRAHLLCLLNQAEQVGTAVETLRTMLTELVDLPRGFTKPDHIPPPEIGALGDGLPGEAITVIRGGIHYRQNPGPGQILDTLAEAPAYAHALVDALVTGDPLDFAGSPVPDDIQHRLTAAGGWCAPTDYIGLCCDSHTRTCEPPSELCCARCPEAAHPQHPTGIPCILQTDPSTGQQA